MEIKNIYKKEVEISIGLQEGKKFFGEYWNSWEDSRIEKRIKKEEEFWMISLDSKHAIIKENLISKDQKPQRRTGSEG